MTNLSVLKIIIEDIKNKDPRFRKNVDLDLIISFFKKVEKDKSKFNFAYLNYFLYNNISKEDVAKRKTTSRDLEDVLAVIFNGDVTDEEKRDNTNDKNFYLENETITGFALSNKREKADIKFNKDYYNSVKTLMMNNSEINFGSFEKTTLFSGFGVEKYLSERKGVVSEKIGLGSKPRLLNLLNKIKNQGQYSKFKKRFSNLVEFVFSDDLIILIKDKRKMDLYFIKGKKFTDLLIKKSASPEGFISVINRWEGNSIRMNRDQILDIGKKIHLNFDFLEDHIVNEIIKTEERISKYFIAYVNKYPENDKYKELIFNECERILDKIDSNINNLI